MAKQTFKSINFIDRLHNICHRVKATFIRLPRMDFHISSVKDEKTNRVVNRIDMQIARTNKLNHFKVSDFCMENLQAVGADKNLTTCKLTSDSIISLHNMEKHLEYLIDRESKNINNNSNE